MDVSIQQRYSVEMCQFSVMMKSSRQCVNKNEIFGFLYRQRKVKFRTSVSSAGTKTLTDFIGCEPSRVAWKQKSQWCLSCRNCLYLHPEFDVAQLHQTVQLLKSDPVVFSRWSKTVTILRPVLVERPRTSGRLPLHQDPDVHGEYWHCDSLVRTQSGSRCRLVLSHVVWTEQYGCFCRIPQKIQPSGHNVSMYMWPGDVVVRAFDVRLATGDRGFKSQLQHCRVQPWISCSHTLSSTSSDITLWRYKISLNLENSACEWQKCLSAAN